MIQRIIDVEIFKISEDKWRAILDDTWADGASPEEAARNFQDEFPDGKFTFRFHVLEEVF